MAACAQGKMALPLQLEYDCFSCAAFAGMIKLARPKRIVIVLLCRRAGKHVRLPGSDHHLDGVLDPIAGVPERGGQIGEREAMGVNLCRIEALFRHQGHRAARRAAAFAANAVDVNIVLHEMREIRRHRVVRECRKTDFPAAIGHMNGLIDGGFGAGALDHIIRADPAGELPDDVERVFFGDVDDAVRAELLAYREAAVAGARQDDGVRSQCSCDRHGEQPDRSRANYHHALTGNESAKFGQAVHCGPGGDDKRRFRVTHRVRHPHAR